MQLCSIWDVCVGACVCVGGGGSRRPRVRVALHMYVVHIPQCVEHKLTTVISSNAWTASQPRLPFMYLESRLA